MAKKDRSRMSERALANDKAASKRWKQRQRGVCESCGAETRYSGHGRRVSRLCVPCGKIQGGDAARLSLQGKGPRQRQLRELLELAGPEGLRYSDIRDMLGITNSNTSVLLDRCKRQNMVLRIGWGRYILAPDPLDSD